MEIAKIIYLLQDVSENTQPHERTVVNNAYHQLLRLSLTYRQFTIYSHVLVLESLSTKDIADKFEITIQNASVQMKKMYDLGYLGRDEIPQESGGIEHSYHIKHYEF